MKTMKTKRHVFLLVLSFSFIGIASPVLVSGQTTDRDVLRDRIDMLVSTQEATVEGVPIAATALIAELYARRNYEPAWSDTGMVKQLFDQVVASKKNTRVNLENPITVMLLYWTAEADEDGNVFFRRDVYDRDAPIIKGLDEPFRVSLPEGAREVIGYR